MENYNHPGSKYLPAVVFDCAQPRFLFDGQFEANETREFLQRYTQDAIAAVEQTEAETLKLSFTLKFLTSGCLTAILKMIQQVLVGTEKAGTQIAVKWVIEHPDHVTIVDGGIVIRGLFAENDRVEVKIINLETGSS